VLNACYSELQARAIAQHIDAVVGMQRAIGDHSAVEFAIGFYDAIAASRPPSEAFRFGCMQSNWLELKAISSRRSFSSRMSPKQ
jgi:hypothetical protein